mgnify:CR=1 FL=1
MMNFEVKKVFVEVEIEVIAINANDDDIIRTSGIGGDNEVNERG